VAESQPTAGRPRFLRISHPVGLSAARVRKLGEELASPLFKATDIGVSNDRGPGTDNPYYGAAPGDPARSQLEQTQRPRSSGGKPSEDNHRGGWDSYIQIVLPRLIAPVDEGEPRIDRDVCRGDRSSSRPRFRRNHRPKAPTMSGSPGKTKIPPPNSFCSRRMHIATPTMMATEPRTSPHPDNHRHACANRRSQQIQGDGTAVACASCRFEARADDPDQASRRRRSREHSPTRMNQEFIDVLPAIRPRPRRQNETPPSRR